MPVGGEDNADNTLPRKVGRSHIYKYISKKSSSGRVMSERRKGVGSYDWEAKEKREASINPHQESGRTRDRQPERTKKRRLVN